MRVRIAILTFIFVLVSSFSAFADVRPEFLPKGPYADQIIIKKHYVTGYDEESEQASWVIYEITPSEANPKVKYERTKDFRIDPEVITGSADLDDYSGSGYDRGHLAPANDMAFAHDAMSESFFLSNMSPQLGSFNRGIWRSVETRVHKWAEKELLIVVTGGVLQGDTYIGRNHVLVPIAYYKICYAPDSNKMIGFLLPHKKHLKNVRNFVCSVDKIEEITGIDFFPGIEDMKESQLESSIDQGEWEWNKTSLSVLPEDIVEEQTGMVKMSSSGICHDPRSKYYHRLKNYISFDTLKKCLAAGGRLPKRIN